ncbi:hypothetical protein AQ834_12615, partial [Burkholderia pseudomallei]
VEASKRRSVEASKRRSVEASKRRSVEAPKPRSPEAPKPFFDAPHAGAVPSPFDFTPPVARVARRRAQSVVS